MLDNLVPQPRSQDGTTVTDSKSKAKTGANKKGENGQAAQADQPAQSASSIGGFKSIVSVHCLSWNKTITRASVLASGMGCGLVRVDFVEGGLNKATANNKLTPTFEQLILQINNSAGVEDEDED